MGFSSVLSDLRKERRLSQRKVAADLSISQALLSHYEKGIREPRLEFVVKACEYYAVSADYILGRTSAKENPVMYIQSGGEIWENKKVRAFASSVLLLMNITADAAGMNTATTVSRYLGYSAYKLIRLMGISESCWPSNISEIPDCVFFAKCDAAVKTTEAEIAMDMAGAETKSENFASSEAKMKKDFPIMYSALSEFAKMTEIDF